LPENWPIYPDPHSSPPLYLVIKGWPHDGGLPTRFRTEPEALANKGDAVIGISTGGSSANVISALKLANDLGCKTIGLSGRDGGEMNTLCDINLVVPAEDTPRIQEMHIVIGHTICHLIDQEFSK